MKIHRREFFPGEVVILSACGSMGCTPFSAIITLVQKAKQNTNLTLCVLKSRKSIVVGESFCRRVQPSELREGLVGLRAMSSLSPRRSHRSLVYTVVAERRQKNALQIRLSYADGNKKIMTGYISPNNLLFF